MHLTGVQARSQVTNPLMQIPPDAADAGAVCGTGVGSPPSAHWSRHAMRPCQEVFLWETPQSQACHPTSIIHPWVTLPPLQGATQTMESQDAQRPTNAGLQPQLQQDNSSPLLGSREDSGNQGSPQPCQRQGDSNWGIQQQLGESPFSSPPKSNSRPSCEVSSA